MRIDRVVRPHRRRQDGRSGRARRAACAGAARIPWRSRPTRCRSTGAWRPSPAWPRRPSRRALEHRLVSFLPIDATFSAGQYAELAHAEIDGLLAAGRRPIVVGGTGLYLRAALTELDLRPPPPEGVRERWIAELARERRARRCTRGCARGRRGRPSGSTPTTASGSCARWSCSTSVSSSRRRGPRSCGARRCATPRCWPG